jgi:hypothetical protein
LAGPARVQIHISDRTLSLIVQSESPLSLSQL